MIVFVLLMRFSHVIGVINMIEPSHLKIIQALEHNGTLTEAANALCLSQSALSHQIRYLEKKMDVKFWQKEGRNIRLTQAGQLLLRTAHQVLPILSQAENTLKAYSTGLQGSLRIGVECYPCYEWLTGVIGDFMQKMPDMDIDIINKFIFTGLEGLVNYHIDILVTPDWVKKTSVHYITLAEYELVLVVARQHSLAQLDFIQPQDLLKETLFVFPIARERLDILTDFLLPSHHEAKKIQVIESLEIMLKMTELNRGVCVLPRWLAESKNIQQQFETVTIGHHGMHRKLYLAMRENDKDIAYIKKFIEIGQQSANFSN